MRLVMITFVGALLAWAVVPKPAPPPAADPVPPLLSPFPIIRIVGRTPRRGARITRLTVRAGAGTYVVSRCVGTGNRCRYKQRVTRIPGTRGQIRTIHMRAFERSFRAGVGVLLRIYVAGAGRTGKFTSFKIRSRRSPRRNDGCITGIVLRPVSCPGS